MFIVRVCEIWPLASIPLFTPRHHFDRKRVVPWDRMLVPHLLPLSTSAPSSRGVLQCTLGC
eukprot:2270028-Prymnesium_polylepis.1